MPLDQLYSVHEGGQWPYLNSKVSSLFKILKATRLIIFKTSSSLTFALQAVGSCRPVHKHTLWPTQAGRGTCVVCQSVCETGKWKLWELSFLIALLTWVSAPLRETTRRLNRKPISQSNYHHLQWWRRICFVRHSQIYDWWETCSRQFKQVWSTVRISLRIKHLNCIIVFVDPGRRILKVLIKRYSLVEFSQQSYISMQKRNKLSIMYKTLYYSSVMLCLRFA